jgi:uncharacterized protein
MEEPNQDLRAAAESPTPALPAPEPALHKMFIGPSGLRAGWRFIIYLVACYGLVTAISFALRPLMPSPGSHQLPRLRVLLLGEFISMLAAIVPAIAMSRLEKRPFGKYGLLARGAFGARFWQGALWGIVAISALLASMRGLGVFYFGSLALHGPALLKYGAFWAVFFLIVAFFEEFVSRGYTQFTLADGIGFWPAALILSAAFGALHLGNKGEAWVGALAAALIGLFWCLTLRRTGNLWFAIGMHASWDWGETFLYSVPDSGMTAPGHLMNPSFHGSRWLTGGSVGPEGSLLLFVLIAAMWLLFDRMYPARVTPSGA